MTTSTRTAAALLLLAGHAVCTGGCNTYNANSDASVARAWAPSDFLAPAPGPRTEPVDPGPFTASLDRSAWPLTVIRAGNEQPQHQPIYTTNLHLNTALPRHQGKFPTAGTAHDSPTTEDLNAQVWEGLAAPFIAMSDIILFPVRAVWTRPWQTVDNGLEPYERLPGSQHQAAARQGLVEPEPTWEAEGGAGGTGGGRR